MQVLGCFTFEVLVAFVFYIACIGNKCSIQAQNFEILHTVRIYTTSHVSLRHISLICLYVELVACSLAIVLGNLDAKLTF